MTAAVDASRDFFGRVLMLHRAEKRGDRLVCACGRTPRAFRGGAPLRFEEWHPRHVRQEMSVELLWRRPDFMAGVPPLEVNLLHARDIPDVVFLSAVCATSGAGVWAPAKRVQTELECRGYQTSAARSGQAQDQVPLKLVLAKGRRLVKRGLLEMVVRDTWPAPLFGLTDAGWDLVLRREDGGR